MKCPINVEKLAKLQIVEPAPSQIANRRCLLIKVLLSSPITNQRAGALTAGAVEQTFQTNNVRIAFAHRREDLTAVRRPGYTSRDKDWTLFEIRYLTPFTCSGRKYPDVRSRSVGESLRQPFSIRGQRRIDDLPDRNSRRRNSRHNPERCFLAAQRTDLKLRLGIS